MRWSAAPGSVSRRSVSLAELDDGSGIVDRLLGVAGRVETIGRRAALLVAIEADFALPAEPPGYGHEMVEMGPQHGGQARAVLDEEGADVAHVRDFQAGSAEEALQGQLHALLRSPHGEMPDAVAVVALRLRKDETRLPEVTARDLAARHSSMLSPGWKSRFKIQ